LCRSEIQKRYENSGWNSFLCTDGPSISFCIFVRGDSVFCFISVSKDKGAHRPFLTVFDASNQQIQKSIQLPSALGFYFAINPQGNEMYLIERDRIVLFDTVKNVRKGGAISTPAIQSFGGDNAAVTPDGKYLYEPIGESVYLVDLVNKVYVNSFSPGQYESKVAIAPAGKYAYFPDTLANDIQVVDITPQ
jgi:DNA-binding beta-propeller fold protein YncE